MKEQTKTMMVEQQRTVYIANDGTEFTSRYACEDYEEELREKILAESVEEIKEAEGFAPCDGNENMEHWEYLWYKVKTKEDVLALEEAYGDCVPHPVSYPEYINIQKGYDGDCWSTTLSATKDYVERFFSNFGITVTFTETEE